MIPSQTKEEGDYPGCTLLVINTTFLSFLFEKFVMVINSTLFPPGDSVRVLRLNKEAKSLLFSNLSKYLSSMV